MLESILKSGFSESAACSEGLTRIPGRTARTHPVVPRIQTGAQQLRGTEGVLLIMPATIVSSETSLWCHFAHLAADFRARYVERPNMPFFRQILLVSIFCCRATGIGRIHVGISCSFWETRRFQLAHGRNNGGGYFATGCRRGTRSSSRLPIHSCMPPLPHRNQSRKMIVGACT